MKDILRRVGRRIRLLPPGAQIPDNRELGPDHYDRMYLVPDRCEDLRGPYWQSYYYFLWSVIVDRLRRAGVRSVLEVGCGPGRLAAFLLDQGVQHYFGFDFSSVAISMARKRLPHVRFEVNDARSSSMYQEMNYEAIVCTEVLEHVQDDLLVVSLFRAGTRCLCTVPSFPYAGHVRYFSSVGEVSERYAVFFDDFDVLALPHPLSPSGGNKFFLFDGIRTTHMS